MNVGDILQITDVQSYLNQQMLNVYFYRVVSADVDATLEDVAQQFELLVATEVAQVQTVDVSHPQIIVRNLTDGIDIWEEPATIVGVAPAAGNLASFYALGFRLVRTNASTRHGAKRIGGVSEESVTGNSVNAGAMTAVNDVAAAMAGHVDRTGTTEDFDLEPVIVGRFPTGAPNAGELDLATINPVSAVQFIRVTTQTTRRAGRGS